MTYRFSFARAVIALIAIGFIAETGLRLGGVVDFPLYATLPSIEYIPVPNQHGAFLDKNDWAFNDKSMPIERNWQADTFNIMLIGNSIVMGGNPFKQADKLTPLLQTRVASGTTIWPLAVGGWTELNEMSYVDAHPEIADQANYIAWEYMAGALGRATPWNGYYAFPTHRPVCAVYYVMRRYILPALIPGLYRSELPVVDSTDDRNTQRFDAEIARLSQAVRAAHPGIIWLYPKRSEYLAAKQGHEWLPERVDIERIAHRNHLRIVDIAQEPDWNENLYRGDSVHPNQQGNKVLAQILLDEFHKDGVQ